MRILLTSVSAGAGHVRAAEAILSALQTSHPRVQASHINVMDFVTKPFRRLYEGGYIFLANKMPAVWGLLYRISDRSPLQNMIQPGLNFFQRLNAASFLNEVERFRPDVIATTHFLIPQVLSALIEKKMKGITIDCVVTDYVCHSLWMDPCINRYFVAHEGMARDLCRRGVPEEKVVVSGIPIDPVFLKGANSDSLRRRLGLKREVPVLLVLSGGLGFGAMDRTVQKLFSLSQPVQLITVSGKNENLRRQMERLKAPSYISLLNLGYVTNMHELLGLTDLVIGKAGGLTVSEGLAKGAGMIFHGVLPGQEEMNARYVQDNGAGRLVHSLPELLKTVEDCLKDLSLLSKMKENSLLASKPRAAFTIADALVQQGPSRETNQNGSQRHESRAQHPR